MKYVTEILEEISKDREAILNYKNSPILKIIFHHAFTEEGKFILPKGKPPFKKRNEPLGMTPVNFIQELRRWYVFCRADLTDLKRETIYIQMLEGVHPSEAELLLAVKDQRLHLLYKGVDRKLAEEHGFIPVVEEKKKKPSWLWITDGITTKQIGINDEIPNGWKLGMTRAKRTRK